MAAIAPRAWMGLGLFGVGIAALLGSIGFLLVYANPQQAKWWLSLLVGIGILGTGQWLRSPHPGWTQIDFEEHNRVDALDSNDPIEPDFTLNQGRGSMRVRVLEPTPDAQPELVWGRGPAPVRILAGELRRRPEHSNRRRVYASL